MQNQTAAVHTDVPHTCGALLLLAGLGLLDPLTAGLVLPRGITE